MQAGLLQEEESVIFLGELSIGAEEVGGERGNVGA